MDFDYSWKDVTEAQIAALKHAHRSLGGKDEDLPPQDQWHALVVAESQRRAMMVDADMFDYKIGPFDLAEMMLTADNSLWYTQAQAWAKGDTPLKDGRGEKVVKVFQLAGVAICKIVEYGYQDGEWWNVEKIWASAAQRAVALVGIVEAKRLVYELTHVKSAKAAVRAVLMEDIGPVISAGISHLPTLLMPERLERQVARLLSTGQKEASSAAIMEVMAHFDSGIRKKLNRIKREAKAKVHETYEPAECICPTCDNLVAPKGIKPREGHFRNYRGTGACCRGHASYFCTKCNRPHSHASKIGKKHYPDYYGKDWDGTDMEGEKWTG